MTTAPTSPDKSKPTFASSSANEVFQTVIPRSIRLAEAPSFGKPIISYDVRSRGAESYIQLAKEILAHEQAARDAQSVG